MAVEVGEGFGVVGQDRIEVESLRVGEVGVGDGNGNSGPVGAEPAAETIGVIASGEVVVAGFGVPFFALELVILGAGVGVRAFTAERIEVGIVADDARIGGDNTGSAKEIFDVIERSAARGNLRDALASEEYVFGGGVARGVGFGEDVAAGAVPVKRAAGLGDATAIAVVEVVHTRRSSELAFGIPTVGVDAVARGVAGEIITKAGKVIVAVGGHCRRQILRAACVGRCARLRLEIAPCVIRGGIVVAPAIRSCGRGRASGLDTVQLIVSEVFGLAGIQIVGDGIDVASVLACRRIDKAVGDVDSVAARRRGLEFEWLEAVGIDVGGREGICYGGGLFGGEGGKTGLRGVARKGC